MAAPARIGLGIDSRFALTDADQRSIAAEAAELGYTSLWTPAGPKKDQFELCVRWHDASGLDTGISVLPASSWTVDELASGARHAADATRGHFVLGVGSGALAPPIRRMRELIQALRPRLDGVPIYLAGLGPQMLRLAGELYDGAALNWCSAAHVPWSRERVAEGARAAGRDPDAVVIHEFVRVCIDDDASAARHAFAKMTLGYAMARPGADRTKGYRGHFARMGFGPVLDELEARRDAGADLDALAPGLPDALLAQVGYWGPPQGARARFTELARDLDVAIVRLVPGPTNDAAAVRRMMRACAPKATTL